MDRKDSENVESGYGDQDISNNSNEELSHQLSSDSRKNVQSSDMQIEIPAGETTSMNNVPATKQPYPSSSIPSVNSNSNTWKASNRGSEMNSTSDLLYQSKRVTDVPESLSDAKSIWSHLFRALRKSIQREKPVDEKSYLVRHQVKESDDDEVIMPDLPYPQKQFHDENGTGKIGSHFGYSKLDESTQASTYADAAKGLLMSFLGAGVMYGITAVLVRLAGQEGIDPIAVMFVRSLFQAIVFGSTLLCTRTGWRPPPGRALRLIWISVVYCIASISSYEAFDVIPPGSAVATRGAARTIFSIIFAFLILREGVSVGDILGLLCCFGGIALIITSGLMSGDKDDYITPPGLGDNATLIRIYGYTLLIISAIGRSIGHVGVRGAKDDLNTFTVVFYHSSLTVLASGILLATVRQPTSPLSWKGVVFVAVVCVASSIATFTSNQAVKYAHPALVSFGQNADVAVSLTLEHILISRGPQPMELTGVLVIFFGLCGLTLYKWIRSKTLDSAHETLS